MRFLLTFLLLTIFITPALADNEHGQDKEQGVSITRAYAFATMPGAQTGAAFMTIISYNQDDKLIAAKSTVSEITEIHQNLIDPDDGQMMMRKIKSLDLPMDKATTLKPTGYHVMFINMKQPLTLNKKFPLTLVFEKAGEVDIQVSVMPPGVQPDEVMDLNEDQQAATNPVVEFFQNIFKKKEQPVY